MPKQPHNEHGSKRRTERTQKGLAVEVRPSLAHTEHAPRHARNGKVRRDRHSGVPEVRHRGPERRAVVEEAARPRRGLSWSMAAIVFALMTVGSAAWALQDARVLSRLPNRVVDVAAAAGFVPDMPWTPRGDGGGLRAFEEGRLQALALAALQPLAPEDIVQEVLVQRSKLSPLMAARVADTIVREARASGVDPWIILAIIDVESKFDHQAISYRGARGLMQLMPETRSWFIDRTPQLWGDAETDDTLDPAANVRVGVHYFAHLSRGFVGLEHVLQAYNCGPARLLSILKGKSVLPEESSYFADRVRKSYERLRRDYGYLQAKRRKRT